MRARPSRAGVPRATSAGSADFYPNASQGAALLRCRNALRELANTLLANSQLSYTETGRRLTLAELRKVTRDWRGEVLDQGCPASAIYRVGADLDRAFRDCFARPGRQGRKGFPQVKAIGREPGIYLSNQGVRLEGNRVRLPKFGWMRWRGGNLPPGRLAGPSGRKTRGLLSGRVWLDAGERWMLSCLFECAPLAPVEPKADTATVCEKDGEITVSADGGPGRVIREAGRCGTRHAAWRGWSAGWRAASSSPRAESVPWPSCATRRARSETSGRT